MDNLPAAPPAQFNFAGHLLALNKPRATKTAYIDDQGSLSYGALDERIRRAANGLQTLGLRREQRLLLLMHDCTDWPVAFLGALYAGIVPVAVNTLLTANDYAYMLADSRATVVMVSEALLPTLQKAMALGSHQVQHVVVTRGVGALSHGMQHFATWLDAASPAQVATDTAADEAAFWLYSSGSTGRPKGTVHSHSNLYWTAQLYGHPILQLREDDILFSAAKLFFAYGLGNSLTFPLWCGATTVLMAERPTPQACFKRMLDRQATVFFGAPTGYAGMLAAPDVPSRSQVSLRLCSSAGEALPQDIGERWTARFGCQIIDGIGSTEMLHIFLSNRPDDVRYGTTGKPVPGYEIELRDEQGLPVADLPEGGSEIGDLYIQGPSSALMYWNNQAKSRETFQGTWTKAGDKYRRDADGYYLYAGRGDDMLKVSGQYVSPFEVEATLVQHPAVLEAAVIGVRDANGLTRAKAFVVLKDGQGDDALRQTLQAFVKARLAPHKYPRQIAFVAELPKTATGKIQRFKLREQEQAA